jgi:hypothetical protein
VRVVTGNARVIFSDHDPIFRSDVATSGRELTEFDERANPDNRMAPANLRSAIKADDAPAIGVGAASTCRFPQHRARGQTYGSTQPPKG